MSEPSIILASKSRARASMLKNAGLEIKACSAGLDEAEISSRLLGQNKGPEEIARRLSAAKAEAVSAILKNNARVIGADQTLSLEGRLFRKPADLIEARNHLLALRGKTHQLFSAVTVITGGEICFQACDAADLTMRAFSQAFLDDYLARIGLEALETVGSYRVEGPGIQLFERIEGDFFTILGLPLMALLAFLRTTGGLPGNEAPEPNGETE